MNGVKPSIALREIEFQNYKAFRRFRLQMQRINILAGPNNCGKSTVVGALRILSTVLRTARVRKPVWVDEQQRYGYKIPTDNIPISVENVHTDYSDSDTIITFKFDNSNSLLLVFPATGGCNLIPIVDGPMIRTPASFKAAYPFSLSVIPILGPIEHKEALLAEETVAQNLNTHRASRHFRNYWHFNPDGFDEFAERIRQTWPGMTISRPILANSDPMEVFMFAEENRISRELYWCGYGFQTWCQLITHISRNKEVDLLVVDEPEIYLHSDLQRQLIGLLKDAGPNIVMATHSTEIMGEADPADILVIDKARTHSQRLKHVEAVQSTLTSIGSIHNITLVQLARTRRILYVEDTSDFSILRRFAARLKLRSIADGNSITPMPSGGFGSWKEIYGTAKRIEEATGTHFNIAAIYDRDYFPSEEINDILTNLRKPLGFAEVLVRKEIENYLLIPSVLDRVIYSLAAKQSKDTTLISSINVDSSGHLERITENERSKIQAQYVARRQEYFRGKGRDLSVSAQEAIQWFDEQWKNLETRLCIVPGKDILRLFRDKMSEIYGISFSDIRIADEFRPDEIPEDIRALLANLDKFGRSVPIDDESTTTTEG